MPGSASPSPALSREEGTLNGTGGVRLHWQAWSPESPARAAIVVSHGAAEHGGRYRHFVGRVVPEGFAVYILDHRGHGRSEGPRALIDRVSSTVADLDLLVDLAGDQNPGVPVFLLGHSLGGCLALSYALRHQDRLRGLIITSPVAMVTAPAVQRLVVRALSAATPRLGIRKVDAAGISRDPAEVEAYDSDPLVFRGKIPARTVHEAICATSAFPSKLGGLEVPLLVMQGTADTVVEQAGAAMINESAASADKTFRLYDGYFHELFNEPAGHRERPLDDVVSWLNERV